MGAPALSLVRDYPAEPVAPHAAVLRDPSLSVHARLVYALACACPGIGVSELLTSLRVSRSTLGRAVAELRAAGYLANHRRGAHGAASYVPVGISPVTIRDSRMVTHDHPTTQETSRMVTSDHPGLSRMVTSDHPTAEPPARARARVSPGIPGNPVVPRPRKPSSSRKTGLGGAKAPPARARDGEQTPPKVNKGALVKDGLKAAGLDWATVPRDFKAINETDAAPERIVAACQWAAEQAARGVAFWLARQDVYSAITYAINRPQVQVTHGRGGDRDWNAMFPLRASEMKAPDDV